MKRKVISLLMATILLILTVGPFEVISSADTGIWMPNSIRVAEELDRGLVVMKTTSGIYLTWRLQADEDNVYGTGKENVSFDIYRDGVKIATESNTTNYIDSKGTVSSKYQVVKQGENKAECEEVTAFSTGDNYFDIEVNKPAATTLPRTATFKNANGNSYVGFADADGNEISGWDNENAVWDEAEYALNDASCGDIDGDGEYEIIVKWECGARDNSQTGLTGTVYLDAYEMDGTRLWRIDLGKNIRSGAHYTQFLVYDFDGDGKAEVTCKTAPGSKDSSGAYVSSVSADSTIKSTDNTASYINGNGYVLDGPEYFTVFNGQTGAAIDTIYYPNQRISASVWGDTYGNRCDRFTAAVAYLDGTTPYAVYMRGYYMSSSSERQAACAISFDGTRLDCEYSFDTYDVTSYGSKSSSPSYSSDGIYLGVNGYVSGNEKYVGQGNHNCTVADVDNDGCDEVMTGALCYELKDEILTPLWCTYKQHGDALHIGDYDPTHSGYEFFVVHEDGGGTNSLGGTDVTLDFGLSVIDAATGEIMFHKSASKDTGRGMMADVGAGGYYQINAGNQVSAHIAKGNNEFEESTYGFSNNFRVFWDGDTYDELLDGTEITSWNKTTSSMQDIFNADGCVSINGSKANPSLQADLFGDWREEVIYPLSNSSALRVYTSNIYTKEKMKSLMYDSVYREGVAAEQTAYNQPPHVGYYIEHPVPEVDTTYEKGTSSETAWSQNDLDGWTQTGTATFQYANDDSNAVNGYISCSQTNPSASYSMSKSFTLKENAVVTYDMVWRYGGAINKSNSTMDTANYEFLQIGDNIRLAWCGAPSYYYLYYSTDGGATYTNTGVSRTNKTYYSNVTAVFDTSNNMLTSLSVEGNSILSNVITDMLDSVSFGFVRGSASLFSNTTNPFTALASIKVTQEYEGETPVITPTPTAASTVMPTSTPTQLGTQTFDEDVAVVEATGVTTWDTGSLAGWFLNRADSTGTVQVTDGAIKVYVGSNNKTYLGFHADTVENVKDKVVTFEFDYKTTSVSDGSNKCTQIVVFSTDSEDITWNSWSGNGASLYTSDSGMSTYTVYHVEFTIDNSEHTINYVITDSEGNVVKEESLTNDGSVDVNTIVFRTGKGVTDNIDNFYYSVEEPIVIATPTVAPTATPSPTPTVKPTPAPTATPTVVPTVAPTISPTISPTTAPTVAPTATPTVAPTTSPTVAPTVAPTTTPTTSPTVAPTTAPTATPDVDLPEPTPSPTPTVCEWVEYDKTENQASITAISMRNATVIFASFDENGKLVSISAEDGIINVGTTTIKPNENFVQTDDVRVYVWESLKTMKPIFAVAK